MIGGRYSTAKDKHENISRALLKFMYTESQLELCVLEHDIVCMWYSRLKASKFLECWKELHKYSLRITASLCLQHQTGSGYIAFKKNSTREDFLSEPKHHKILSNEVQGHKDGHNH